MNEAPQDVHPRDLSHDDAMVETFRSDPDYAVYLLNSILEDEEGTVGELLMTLRQIAKAHGGVPALAEDAKLNPTQLYRTLSEDGNPTITSLTAILRALNLRLAIQPIATPNEKNEVVHA